jgi:hypothetical protein
MRHRTPKTLEHRILLGVIFHEAESARRFQTDITAFPCGFDLRRETGECEALVDMPARNSKAPSDIVRRGAFGTQSRLSIDLVHGVHRNTVNVLDQRDLTAVFASNNMARNGKVLGDGAGLGELFQRQETSPASVDLELVPFCGNDTEIL